jgi:serine protease Do
MDENSRNENSFDESKAAAGGMSGAGEAGNGAADTAQVENTGNTVDAAQQAVNASAQGAAQTAANGGGAWDAANAANASQMENNGNAANNAQVAQAPHTGEAAVDYGVAAGQSEVIRRTVAYNSGTADTQTGAQDASSGAAYGAGAGAGAEGTQAGAGGGYTTESTEYFNNVYGQAPEAEKKQGIHFKKPKPLSDKAKRVLAIVLIIVLCGGAGFGGGAIAVNTLGGSSSSGSQTIKIDSSSADSLNAASAIAEKVMPSVVGISTTKQTYTETIFGLQQGTSTGIGTGIIVSEDGYILTNSHVVGDGSYSTITVDLYDGTEYEGDVLWNDSTLDLAIVKIDATGLTAAELGDSDDVAIGDYAVAIGNPLGLDFERSVTQGIISGLDRSITVSNSDSGTTNTMEGLIQTDASINSGNSGGPLINSDGQVIGINSAKASSGEGLGFAIPINTALPIIEEIKETGSYEQAYIGISGMNVSTVTSQYVTDFNAESGVYINQIYTNSPAATAGLQEGDIITAIDGTEVEDMSALKRQLVNYRPGDTVTLTVERNKATKKIELTLGSSSDSEVPTLQQNSSSSDSSNGSSGSGNSGSSGGSYNGSLGDLFGGIYGN